ncbi:MAG: hypothetical protein LBN94_01035 [Puniceicoccales bacterium]|jgi:hypothetical protein|nr:hypothetical protein [Puniceicoccales bacterium]
MGMGQKWLLGLGICLMGVAIEAEPEGEEGKSFTMPYWKKTIRSMPHLLKRHHDNRETPTPPIPPETPEPPKERHVKFNLDHYENISQPRPILQRRVKSMEVHEKEVKELRKNMEKVEDEKDGERRLMVPEGYVIKNVPGDGLCGYWAGLVAKKAREIEQTTATIGVSREEVFELLGRLSRRIGLIFEKQNKTDEEREIVEEIDQLIRDGYAQNFQDLCRKTRSGQMQLDSPLAVLLAKELGHDIILETERFVQGRIIRVRHVYRSHKNAQVIRIYYMGGGTSGHYQAIIPRGIEVQYR